MVILNGGDTGMGGGLGGDVGDAYRTDGDEDVDADENMRLTYQSSSREEKRKKRLREVEEAEKIIKSAKYRVK